jgi:hypothetical protein
LALVDTHRGVPENEHFIGGRAGPSKTVWVENQDEWPMSSFSLQRNAELQAFEQNYGDDPLTDRATDLYRREFVTGFVEKWDELIDRVRSAVAGAAVCSPALSSRTKPRRC